MHWHYEGEVRMAGKQARANELIQASIRLMCTREYDEGLAAAEKAVALDPKSERVLAYLAEAYFHAQS
jgi:hypothetical protein